MDFGPLSPLKCDIMDVRFQGNIHYDIAKNYNQIIDLYIRQRKNAMLLYPCNQIGIDYNKTDRRDVVS